MYHKVGGTISAHFLDATFTLFGPLYNTRKFDIFMLVTVS